MKTGKVGNVWKYINGYCVCMSGNLLVDFCGEEYDLAPDKSLTFGREADLEIDDNPYLHRVLGCFEHSDGHWWLANLGASTPLGIADLQGATAATVAPGSRVAISFGDFSVNFSAGPHRYELLGSMDDDDSSTASEQHADLNGARTLEWGLVSLNDEQRLLLLALCEPYLRAEASEDGALPASRACAQRLGWTISKFNRKLDHLCQKISRTGVSGLYGAEGLQATNRRQMLADHAVRVGLVNASELPVLEEYLDRRNRAVAD